MEGITMVELTYTFGGQMSFPNWITMPYLIPWYWNASMASDCASGDSFLKASTGEESWLDSLSRVNDAHCSRFSGVDGTMLNSKRVQNMMYENEEQVVLNSPVQATGTKRDRRSGDQARDAQNTCCRKDWEPHCGRLGRLLE